MFQPCMPVTGGEQERGLRSAAIAVLATAREAGTSIRAGGTRLTTRRQREIALVASLAFKALSEPAGQQKQPDEYRGR
jgi:hypothetical protein